MLSSEALARLLCPKLAKMSTDNADHSEAEGSEGDDSALKSSGNTSSSTLPSERLIVHRIDVSNRGVDISASKESIDLAPQFTAGSIFFVGTATVIIRFGGLTIMTDPNFLHKGVDIPLLIHLQWHIFCAHVLLCLTFACFAR